MPSPYPYTMTIETISSTWFDQAHFIPPDAIFALTAQYLADPFPQKVNLGQGTYRDENGNPWVLPSVQKSREILSQKLNHEYLPIVGLASFRQEAAKLALGPELFAKQQDKVLYSWKEMRDRANQTIARHLPESVGHWSLTFGGASPASGQSIAPEDLYPRAHLVQPPPGVCLSRFPV